MGRHLQLVLGPAGAGKSTYCYTMEKHFEAKGRQLTLVNLDPAAENFKYSVAIDVRELISLDDVKEEINLGPNGGLVFCYEHLYENIDWLKDRFDEAAGSDDEYFIVDCPGQIELFTHNPVMKKICQTFKSWNIHVCAVYLLDAMFVDDPVKYISGTMMALSTMVQLEVAHVNVFSKWDLRTNRLNKNDEEDEWYNDGNVETTGDLVTPDTFKLRELIEKVHPNTSPTFKRLNGAICSLLEDYSMINFIPLNAGDEDSIEHLLLHIDNALQYGEDVEVKNADVLDEVEIESDESDNQ